MTKKIAILRGINVGGKRKVLMADLKLLAENRGLNEVRTYIQSGNLIFKSDDENSAIEYKLEQAITDKYGFDVPVIVRSLEELRHSIANNPFYDATADINQLHLTFLKDQPQEVDVSVIEQYNGEPDQFSTDDRDVFIFCSGKYHQSKLSNGFFEKKLKVGATTRNWKTVLKLLEICEG